MGKFQEVQRELKALYADQTKAMRAKHQPAKIGKSPHFPSIHELVDKKVSHTPKPPASGIHPQALTSAPDHGEAFSMAIKNSMTRLKADIQKMKKLIATLGGFEPQTPKERRNLKASYKLKSTL